MNKIMQRLRKGEGGFTLVEVLAAVTIIGFLAGVVLFSTASSRREAVWKSCQQEAASLDVAVASYIARNGYAPADDNGGAGGLTQIGKVATTSDLVLTFLRSMPNNLTTGAYRVNFDRAGATNIASDADVYQVVGRINTGNYTQYVCYATALSGANLTTVVAPAGQGAITADGPQAFPG